MRALRIDFHVHSRISPDGLDTPERLVAAAKRAGLHGIAITDHDRGAAYARLVDAGLANLDGTPVDDFLVIPGVEVSTNQGHVLLIGGSFDTPSLRGGIDAADLANFAHQRGYLVVAAHPYDRFRSGVGHAVLDSVDFDAIEACNSKTFDRHANRLAADHAARIGLPALGGSDAHEACTVGRSHTLVVSEVLSLQSVLTAVRRGRATPVAGAHTRTELWRYWIRGWLTRPWLLELSARGARRMVGNVRNAVCPTAVSTMPLRLCACEHAQSNRPIRRGNGQIAPGAAWRITRDQPIENGVTSNSADLLTTV